MNVINPYVFFEVKLKCWSFKKHLHTDAYPPLVEMLSHLKIHIFGILVYKRKSCSHTIYIARYSGVLQIANINAVSV